MIQILCVPYLSRRRFYSARVDLSSFYTILAMFFFFSYLQACNKTYSRIVMTQVHLLKYHYH